MTNFLNANSFASQNCVSSNTQIYVNILFIYISHNFHIFFHFSMPKFVTQPPTRQLSHLQRLLVLLMLVGLILLMVSSFSTVNSLSICPPSHVFI